MEDVYRAQRFSMVKHQIEARGVHDESVLEAMRRVPRHEFVNPEALDMAYADFALSLSHGQTISQPYIVGLMTELARPGLEKRVLEIGTGSGYQTAVLAELCQSVTTIEVVPELAAGARTRLEGMGYNNIHFVIGDGYEGYKKDGPYDLIIATACPPEIPMRLVEQLAVGGRMVLPVGDLEQYLVVVRKDLHGKITLEKNIPVRFVPMIHKG